MKYTEYNVLKIHMNIIIKYKQKYIAYTFKITYNIDIFVDILNIKYRSEIRPSIFQIIENTDNYK